MVVTNLPPLPVEQPICNGTSNYDELGTVNSLYGVGTVIGWYLTAIGLLLTWIFHAEKRRRDRIPVDLIVVLTLPLVAAGHLTHSMWNQPSWRLQNGDGDDARWDESHRSDQFAAFAPLEVLRAYRLFASLLLLNPVLFLYGTRRTLLIYATELIAANIEFAYMHMFSLGLKSILFKNPDGLEPIKAFWVLATLMDISVVLPPAVGVLCVYFKYRRDPDSAVSEMTGVFLGLTTFWTNMIFLVAFGNYRPTIVSAQQCPSQHQSFLRLSLFPISDSSFRDLDQAVPAAAGATTLSARLYSICIHQYKRWRSRKERRALLKIDPSTHDQPAYTDDADEGQGSNDAPSNSNGSQDIEMGTMAAPSRPEDDHQQFPSEIDLTATRADFLMSGAIGSEDDEEPGAPLPLVDS